MTGQKGASIESILKPFLFPIPLSVHCACLVAQLLYAFLITCGLALSPTEWGSRQTQRTGIPEAAWGGPEGPGAQGRAAW